MSMDERVIEAAGRATYEALHGNTEVWDESAIERAIYCDAGAAAILAADEARADAVRDAADSVSIVLVYADIGISIAGVWTDPVRAEAQAASLRQQVERADGNEPGSNAIPMRREDVPDAQVFVLTAPLNAAVFDAWPWEIEGSSDAH